MVRRLWRVRGAPPLNGSKKIETQFDTTSSSITTMYSFTISRAFPTITKEFVADKIKDLELGEFTIDELEVTRHDKPYKQFWIHFTTMADTELAKSIKSRLDANAARQKSGEVLESSDIPRIVYGVNRRNGNDLYWQLYKCATPEERKVAFEAREAEKEHPKVKIVL